MARPSAQRGVDRETPLLSRADPPRRRASVEVPREREYEVIGPKSVGGASRGERVTLCLTDAAENALIEAGHVKPASAKEGV